MAPSHTSLPPVVGIFGPTSSGKTALSLELAESLPTVGGQEIEVVGADSRQVYVGMNIGTSKVGREITSRLPHHCLDLCPPDKMLALADYQARALRAIREIHERGRLPVMVGGTGTYLLSVVENWKVGEDLLDKEANFAHHGKQTPLFRAVLLRPPTSLSAIQRRIDKAVEAMVAQGLVEEVVQLAERYRLWEPKRLERNALWHTHGYREFLERAHTYKPVRLLPSKRDLPAIVEAIQEHTRAYAARQWSWFKKMPPVQTVSSGKEAAMVIKKFLASDAPRAERGAKRDG